MIWNIVKWYLLFGVLFEIFQLSMHHIAYYVGTLRQPEKKAVLYSAIAYLVGVIVWPYQFYILLKTIYDVKKGKRTVEDIDNSWDEILNKANGESH